MALGVRVYPLVFKLQNHKPLTTNNIRMDYNIKDVQI